MVTSPSAAKAGSTSDKQIRQTAEARFTGNISNTHVTRGQSLIDSEWRSAWICSMPRLRQRKRKEHPLCNPSRLKSFRRAQRFIRRMENKLWREAIHEATKFYGHAAMRDKRLLLMDSAFITHIVNKEAEEKRGTFSLGRVPGGCYVLAPKAAVIEFYKKRGLFWKNYQRATSFQFEKRYRFTPTVDFPKLLIPRPPIDPARLKPIVGSSRFFEICEGVSPGNQQFLHSQF